MPILIFIRHAETDYNRAGIFAGRTDCNITNEGLEQSKRLLKDEEKDFDYIYCSPLKRILLSCAYALYGILETNTIATTPAAANIPCLVIKCVALP